MKKRFLAMFLALVMCLTLLPTAALAASVTEAVPCKYEDVGEYRDGFVIVLSESTADGGYKNAGVIDKKGNEIVPMGKYDYISYPHEGDVPGKGLLMVRQNGKYGFVNPETGAEVFPCKYDYADYFYEGFAVVGTGEESNRKYGFVDMTGKETVPCKYDYLWHFDQGVARIRMGEKEGYIDKAGREIVPPGTYSSLGWFREGMALVSDNTFLHGYIDTTGKAVTPCQFKHAMDFSDGMAVVAVDGGKEGYIDKTGKVVIPCQYKYANKFSEGMASVSIDGRKYGYIDKSGREIVPCKYDNAQPFLNGLGEVTLNGKSGYVNKIGLEVTPCKYDLILSEGYGFSRYGLSVVELDGKYGLLDSTGKEVAPCKYGMHYATADDVVIVRDQGKWGVIDKTGKECVPMGKYSEVGGFFNGLGRVRQGDKWGYVDRTGAEIVPCKYEAVGNFSDGMAAVKQDGKWGFLAISGVAASEPFTPTDPGPAFPVITVATPTNDKLSVDGKDATPAAYKINSANYFKLRDVAMLLNGTKAQFSIEYDSTRNAIMITTGKPYSPIGGELTEIPTTTAQATPSNDTVYINGVEASFSAYKIASSNYYGIRDLGKALNFNVGWNPDHGMYIETDKPYTDAD